MMDLLLWARYLQAQTDERVDILKEIDTYNKRMSRAIRRASDESAEAQTTEAADGDETAAVEG